jgi:hypothetical protein
LLALWLVAASNRGGSSKPSFQTAASQAREPSSGKASFTITRPADGASRVVVTAGAGSAASGANPTRQVILRGEDSSRSSNASVSATMRRITIETSADSGRQVVRAGTKRRSGDMGASTGSGLSLRRTVVNNAAMDAEGDDDNEQRMAARESTFKRGRFIIENNSAATAGRGRVSAAVPLSANPLAVPAHLPGVQFSAVLASRIAQAAAERLAAARPITNAASGSVALSPLPAAAAAVSPSPSVVPAAASARASPQPASPSVHVLLRNLAPSMTEKFVLKQVFPLYDVPHISLDKDPATGLCSGTGDVWFSSTLQAEEAVKLNQGQTFLMHQIRLSIIRDNEEQPQPMRQAPAVPAAATQQPQWPQQPLSFRVPVGSAPVASQSKPVSASFPSAAAAAAAAPFAPAVPAASAALTGATPSPLSHSLTNVGFVGVFGDADAHMSDDSGEETVFNITNLRGTNYAAGAASAGSYSPTPASQYAPSTQQSSASAASAAAAAAASRPKVLQLRPKSVVVSGAEAMAGVSASGKPSFTTTRNAPSVHNSSADSGWQPKTVVLAPRR